MKIQIICEVTPCRLVNNYSRFEESWCLRGHGLLEESRFRESACGGARLYWNDGKYLKYKWQQPRRLEFSKHNCEKSETSQNISKYFDFHDRWYFGLWQRVTCRKLFLVIKMTAACPSEKLASTWNITLCPTRIRIYKQLEVLAHKGWKIFLLNNQREALIIPILFCYRTLHVSGIFSAPIVRSFLLYIRHW